MAEVDFAKKYLKAGEVERVLGRTRAQVERLVAAGRLSKRRIGSQWRYPTGEVRAVMRSLGLVDEKNGEGSLEATAIALIQEGHSDGEIVRRLELPVATVERLRVSLGKESTADAYKRRAAAELPDDRPTLAKTRVAEARARLEAQRIAMRRRLYGDNQ